MQISNFISNAAEKKECFLRKINYLMRNISVNSSRYIFHKYHVNP